MSAIQVIRPARAARAASAAALVLVLAACSSSPPAPAAAAAGPAAQSVAQAPAGEQQICTREVPVGSMRPVTRCVSATQAERERQEGRKALEFTRQNAGEARPDAIGR